ncbi:MULTISPECIES: outer membrane protein assembly factor BamA [Marinobacter]|uniref:outer membrane protein assembly factor BamA n=1 Tax=Marinobacter TaxID=2742 RepID=UPI001C948C01|nr:outer membrane protein assembly factor BamA [Marinobacter nauticus]MBY5937570.1 outer membrane protein assembly factor BamA [Marinobacter nauticus]MBY5954798.1 outer membrane protein assembly factor BamA [Marinobacter nauticus]MBY6008591.1 outer membrane protein assembly factor BamA [Marinobacter nauticus]MBY6104842.1 outer membrane protein assembly factor BamA [Marinobacter nauticus]
MRRSLLAVAVGLAITATGIKPALADEFTVADIEVEGLQRVSAGSVFSAFPVNIGERMDETRLADAIKDLFRTGLFTDIQASRDEGVLILSVRERPSISSIEIEGNKNIETEMLMDALAGAGLEEGQVFRRATLEKLELEILRSYIAQGRYNARVKATAEELPRNRVAIRLDINEGSVAAIQHINIVGNEDFSDEELIGLFELRTSSWWNSLTNKDKYARERLSGDLESLRSFYLDRGYLDFNVESSQVSISPDKQEVFIAIAVNEGPQYTISDIRLRGELIVGEEELRKFIPVKEGDVFSRAQMTAISEALSFRLGREGYAFANVNAVPEPGEDNTAAVTFFVEPGKRAYVRRVNFDGNVSTKDEVLRQEMTQMEGGVASSDRIEFSKTRLERLGFFQTVDVETVPVPGTDDLVDVNYSVQEQPTGSLSASVGFSQNSGVILGASVSENNFFGTGKRVSFGVNFSDSVKSANISYLDPYYTVDGVSRGFSLFARETDYEEEDISSYLLDEYGGRVTFGYPTDSITRLNFGAGVTQSNIKPGVFSAQEVRDFIAEEGDSFTNYFLFGSWRRSTLNRGVLPTNGYSHSLSLDVAVPGSDLTFYKATHKTDFYFPLTDSANWVFRARSEIGYGDGYGDRSQMPFFEHFYSGGYGSVRGYEANSLGNKAERAAGDFSDPDPFGGNVLTEGGLELIFPTPFAGDSRSMRTSVFVDAGQVFDTERGFDPELGEVRTSAGISFQWITAVGPLAFSLAKPLNDKSGDDTQVFQFSLGQTF